MCASTGNNQHQENTSSRSKGSGPTLRPARTVIYSQSIRLSIIRPNMNIRRSVPYNWMYMEKYSLCSVSGSFGDKICKDQNCSAVISSCCFGWRGNRIITDASEFLFYFQTYRIRNISLSG